MERNPKPKEQQVPITRDRFIFDMLQIKNGLQEKIDIIYSEILSIDQTMAEILEAEDMGMRVEFFRKGKMDTYKITPKGEIGFKNLKNTNPEVF